MIFKNPKSNPPTRNARWLLRVTPYNFTIRLEAEKSNIADFLSRQHIEDEGTGEFEAISEEYVNYIAWSSHRTTLSPDTNDPSANASALSIIIESPDRVQIGAAEKTREDQAESVASTRPVRSKSMPNRLVVNLHAKKIYD